MRTVLKYLWLAAGLMILLPWTGAAAGDLTPKEELGKLIFFDTNLSTPPGVSCATCHDPAAGFADPRMGYPTSRGSVPTRFGSRNSPTSAYLIAGPEELRMFNGFYAGGKFWDGRANTLVDQALGPFMNPLEMKNPNAMRIVMAVRRSPYASLFKSVFGENIFSDHSAAFHAVAEAIAEYEKSSEVNPFTSKFDYYLKGEATLTPDERMGMMVFHGKGACSQCHSQGRAVGQKCPGGCACGCAFTGVCTCGPGCTCGCPQKGATACAGGCMCGCAVTGVCTCANCSCGCLQTNANACPGGCTCGCAFTRFCTCGPGCQCGCPSEAPVCAGGCACGCEWTHVCTCGPDCPCGCPQGGMTNGLPLLTNHGYFNLGVPRNPANPFYAMPPAFNPDGINYVDYGLAAVLADRGIPDAEAEMGKMKVPTLRNVALTAPYMHNGVFADVRTVIEFYNTRDVAGAPWDPPEVQHANIFREMGYGNIGLTEEEIDALVAFLGAFTDGYVPENPQGAPAKPMAFGGAPAPRAIAGTYPNPFNPSTTIFFNAPEAGRLRLSVYDVAGRRIRVLLDEFRPAGPGTATWDGRDDIGRSVASGVYFCRLEAGRFRETARLVLLR